MLAAWINARNERFACSCRATVLLRAVVGWLPWLECCHGGYRLFRKNRPRGQGGEIALYMREELECIELSPGMDDAWRSPKVLQEGGVKKSWLNTWESSPPSSREAHSNKQEVRQKCHEVCMADQKSCTKKSGIQKVKAGRGNMGDIV